MKPYTSNAKSWKIVICFLFCPLQTSLSHLFNNCHLIALRINKFILCMVAFFVHIKFLLLFVQMQHVLNLFIFPTSFKSIKLQPQSWVDNAHNLMDFTNITLHHFSPWKLCSPNLFTFGRDVIYIFVSLL